MGSDPGYDDLGDKYYCAQCRRQISKEQSDSQRVCGACFEAQQKTSSAISVVTGINAAASNKIEWPLILINGAIIVILSLIGLAYMSSVGPRRPNTNIERVIVIPQDDGSAVVIRQTP